MKVNGKVIVVTGGGNGMGRQITLQLLEKGAHVAAVDVNMKGLEETRDLAGNDRNLTLHQVDITDKEQVQNLVAKVIRAHGVVDGIINNAGIIQPFINVSDVSDEIIDRIMNVNFYGTLYMVRAFLPELLKRPEAHVLNVSSMGGFFPVPGQSIYGASKAAVKLMTEGMAAELKDTNVSVSVVIPGGIATDIKKNSNIVSDTSKDEKTKENSKIILTPEKAASLIIETMEKNLTIAYIGKDSKLMNGLYKLSPKFAGYLIGKVLQH
ncbi:SDR family oxidoreductase [Fusibacter paucivorans]|uniref:SDR family oxidoreductase n=1 Tax=Fusibacter paucivorans TaxID=76009 RepID=A0ABS5PSM4_9FIRM|nr:SDR family oxidoreductase [Fusibacter paucivorans]MBS7527872.1 SDR family oxidoreductase [Fusibacter paucivorans]